MNIIHSEKSVYKNQNQNRNQNQNQNQTKKYYLAVIAVEQISLSLSQYEQTLTARTRLGFTSECLFRSNFHPIRMEILRFALLISAFRTDNFNSLTSSPLS